VDASKVDVSPSRGQARFKIESIAIPDFHDFLNAISPNPATVPGHASFEVVWAGGGDRQNVRDRDFGFGGEFVTGAATISFRVSDDNDKTVYTSDPDGQTNPGPPAVGHERNGVFFH